MQNPMFENIYFNTFDELLQQGRKQLQNTKGNLTGIEQQLSDSVIYNEDMIKLNNYMYTTYSTNRPWRDSFSLMADLPLKIALELSSVIDCKLWYTIHDNTGKLIKHNIDKVVDRINNTFIMVCAIPEDSDYLHKVTTIDDFLGSKGWYLCTGRTINDIIDSIPSQFTIINLHTLQEFGEDQEVYFHLKKAYFHFPDQSNLNQKDNESTQSTQSTQSTEYSYVESAMYSNPEMYEGDNRLVSMSFEDPIIGRKTLYKYLYDVCEKLKSKNS